MAEHSYINPLYLQNTRQLKKAFQKGSVQLREFLNNECFEEMHELLAQAQWKIKAVPDLYFYKTTRAKDITRFMHSKEFLELLKEITGANKIKFETCQFSHGNYQLLNTKQGIAFILELTPAWNARWGGYTSFTGKEEIRVQPLPNTLTLVKQNTKHYVKYVNHLAGENKRMAVIGVLI